MYTSPDEARSDLFLSGAIYLLGPLVLSILLSFIPVAAIPGAGPVLTLVQPVLFTALVPLLLTRYRKESLSGDYGLAGRGASVPTGVIAAVPIVVAGVVAALVAGLGVGSTIPLLGLGSEGGTDIVSLLARVLYWVGLAFLGGYATVKARDAFRGSPVRLDEVVVRVGRIVGIACGVALALLIVAGVDDLSGDNLVGYVLLPLAVAAAVWITLRRDGGATTTTTATVLTPTVLFALGPFGLSFNALLLALGIYFGALFAGVGLIVAIMVERRRTLTGVLVLGLVIGLLSGLGAGDVFVLR